MGRGNSGLLHRDHGSRRRQRTGEQAECRFVETRMCRLRTSIRRTTKIPISDDFTTDKVGIQLPSVYRRQRNNCNGVSRMYNVVVLIRLSISTCGNGLSQVILTLSTLGQTVSRSCLAAAGLSKGGRGRSWVLLVRVTL